MKCLLIGLGRMGMRHAQVIRDLGLELSGAAELSAETRLRAAGELGLPADRVFADGFEAIDRLQPDVVIVATTAPSHAALVCHAAAGGAKAILCEKPMAVSLADCDRMMEACRKSGTRLAINHQMRFMEQYTLPRTVVSGPEFGGLGSMQVICGNFGMAMNASHYFEAFRVVAGEPPISVQAWFSEDTVPNPRGAQFEDRAGCIRLETASGRRFYLDCSSDQGHGMFVSYAGRFGRLDIDELAGHMWLTRRKPEHRALPTTRYGMPWDKEDRPIAPADAIAPTRAVLEALLAGEDFPDGEVGRTAVEILVAAYLSHEQGGKMIHLQQTALPRERVFPWA